MGPDNPDARPRIVSEGPWLRTLQIGPKQFHYESKFLFDGLQIKAADFIEMWPQLSSDEQWEFGMAYQAKPSFTSEDEEILYYLMSENGRGLWQMIPILLVRHPDRSRAINFLTERIRDKEGSKSNYYQALELMNAVEAEPLLMEQIMLFDARIDGTKVVLRDELLDYIMCVRALTAISVDKSWGQRLTPLLSNADPTIRSWAENAIERR